MMIKSTVKINVKRTVITVESTGNKNNKTVIKKKRAVIKNKRTVIKIKT